MILGRFHHQSGIALGPILFIIAILALLAAAISAGSGGFNASTSTESAKAMAEVIVNSCGAYQDALNLMFGNGCDVTKIDWTPNVWPSGATIQNLDFTGGNGTGHTGNGQCAMYDPRGGGMLLKSLPPSAQVTTRGVYIDAQANSSAYDTWASYPMIAGTACLKGFSSSSTTGAVILTYNYVDSNVCSQIDTLLQINGPSSKSMLFSWSNSDQNSLFLLGWNIGIRDGSSECFEQNNTAAATSIQGCYPDAYASGNANTYYCGVMIR